MVSKTPTKPSPIPKTANAGASVAAIGCRRSSGKKVKHSSSPIKAISASLNRSVRSCRRRLIKVFARLTILGRSTSTPHKLGFRRLRSTPTKDHSSKPSLPLLDPLAFASLPPLSSPNKKTIFFDLDETLIHSQTNPVPDLPYDFVVHPSIDGRVVPFYVLKRPGVDELLKAAAAASFEVVVFTAGLEAYASLVLDHLDPGGELITHRLYRDACKKDEGRLIKDLAAVGRMLDRAVIVDDNPNAYMYQPENAIPVAPFTDNLGDRELQKVIKFLEMATLFEDMRDAAALYRSEFSSQKPKSIQLQLQ